MPGRHDPRDLVNGKAYVVAARLERFAGVHADAYPDTSVARPREPLERPLRLGGCGHASRCGRERCEQRIALSAENSAARVLDRCADQCPRLVEQLRVPVAEGLEQARRALDVREQEGRRASRAFGHRQNVSSVRVWPGQVSPRAASCARCVLAGSTALLTWLRSWRACLSAVLTLSLK